MTSKHYSKGRRKRENFIKKYVNGDGNVIEGFVINKGHKDGLEVHSITDNGLILIHNYHTGKLITKLIARPEQIERYYKNANQQPPKWLLVLAEWHMSLLYNMR